MTFHSGKFILHATAASIMAFGYVNLHTLEIDDWVHTQYGGHFQYLTIQGLAIAWLTMVVSLFLDLFPFFRCLWTVKRALLIVALPLSIVISAIYWTLILLFPTLILSRQHLESPVPSFSPEELSLVQIPLPMDLSLHAAPTLTLLADFFLFEPKYGRRAHTTAVFLLLIFATWYSWWAEHCAKQNGGIFPYPFLTENPIEIRVAIYTSASILAYAAFWLINGLHPREVELKA